MSEYFKVINQVIVMALGPLKTAPAFTLRLRFKGYCLPRVAFQPVNPSSHLDLLAQGKAEARLALRMVGQLLELPSSEWG